jgi:multimeric flavodoxin WrbA
MIKDDYDSVIDKLNNADGIIIGTPVYLRNISGTLKNFIDRTCVYYHRTSIEGIPIMSVITTAYSGIKETDRYLSDVIVQWGAINGGTISRRATEIDVDVNQKEIQRFVELLNLDKSKYKPSVKQVVEFNTQKILAVKILKKDLTYWEEKGWLNNNYYYQCRINIFKRIIAKMYFALLMKVIPKID